MSQVFRQRVFVPCNSGLFRFEVDQKRRAERNSMVDYDQEPRRVWGATNGQRCGREERDFQTVCAPKGLNTSGGRTHSNNGWLDSIADERHDRVTGHVEAS